MFVSLKDWISPKHMNPPTPDIRSGRASSYRVLDDVFLPDKLALLRALISGVSMVPDYPDMSYDANARRIDGELDRHGLEFLATAPWHEWLLGHFGLNAYVQGRTVIRARTHDAAAKGFWIHTDRDRQKPKSLAALIYLNDEWTPDDGGLLQIWNTSPLERTESPQFRYADWLDKPLDFLTGASRLSVEVAGVDAMEPVSASLVEEILPKANRMVLLDFVSDDCFHSVTPSAGKARHGIVQWLY